MSPVLNEQFNSGAFLVSEAEGNRSRQVGALDNATSADVYYSAGLVVSLNAGALTSSAGTAAQPANVGNGALSSISQGAAVQFGAYVFTAKSATDFGVVARSMPLSCSGMRRF